jgi:hypothetical protein
VSRTFRKLQAAAIKDPAHAAAIAAAASRDYPSLRDVPDAAFPLFATTAQWLRMLDASCDAPFFGAAGAAGDERDDADGIGLHVELGDWDSEGEGAGGGDEGGEGSDGGDDAGGGGGGAGAEVEMIGGAR